MTQEIADMTKIKQLTESISSSLIREFLARKGLQDVLQHFDKVLPRNDLSVSNRAHLIRLLHIEHLIIKNQESGTVFQTLLEVITKQLLYPNTQPVNSHAIKKSERESTRGPSEMQKWSEGNLASGKTPYENNPRLNPYDNGAPKLELENEKLCEPNQPSPRNSSSRNKDDSPCGQMDDLEVCDLSETEEEQDHWSPAHRIKQSWTTLPISRTEAIALKKLLFGTHTSLTSFTDEWRGQAFSFNPYIRYGFLQKKGGPCGLLAAVQARLLQRFLFTHNSVALQNDKRLFVETSERSDALACTLASILWQASQEKKAVVVIPTQAIGNRDGIESLRHCTFTSLEEIEDYFLSSTLQWESDGFDSCIVFLCSLLLSRGLNNVISDMDDPLNSIIGRHGYCTQEMVNLVLQGRAMSNVFDGDMALNGMVLKGIQTSSQIGFLSLFEHYNTCQVGDYYKNPLYPIWVVLSESHFTVLFSTVYLEESLKMFDLFYYDSLGRQDTEIFLRIEQKEEVLPASDSDKTHELTPPLELCIRTKWKNVAIEWHGSEPLL